MPASCCNVGETERTVRSTVPAAHLRSHYMSDQAVCHDCPVEVREHPHRPEVLNAATRFADHRRRDCYAKILACQRDDIRHRQIPALDERALSQSAGPIHGNGLCAISHR